MVNICCKYKTKIIDITVMGGVFFSTICKKNGEKRKNVNRGMQEDLRIKNQFMVPYSA